MAGKSYSISYQVLQQLSAKEQATAPGRQSLPLTDSHTDISTLVPDFNIHFINKVQTVWSEELYSTYCEHSYRNQRQDRDSNRVQFMLCH